MPPVKPLSRLSAAALLCACVASCGTPPELRRPTATAPPPATAPPSSAPADPVEVPPAVPAYPTLQTLAAPPPVVTTGPPPPPAKAPRCTGGPSPDQVAAAAGRSAAVPPGTQLTVTQGPFCAGEWQFTVLGINRQPAPGPLAVVTRGRHEALSVVEIGTDVCSPGVAADAPPGIRAHACGR